MTSKASLQNLVDAAGSQTSIYARQLGIFNPHQQKLSMSIVGCGAVGSTVALAAAKLGIAEMFLWDMDTVEDVNLPVQMHLKGSIGKNKAIATKEMIEMFGAETKVHAFPEAWEGQESKADIVVAGADSLPVRKKLWEAHKFDPSVKLFCDARIGGQLLKLYYVDPDDSKDIKLYDETFPKNEMKGSELPCAERGVIDVSIFVGAMHVRAIRRFVVKGEKESYLAYNLGGKLKSIMDL